MFVNVFELFNMVESGPLVLESAPFSCVCTCLSCSMWLNVAMCLCCSMWLNVGMCLGCSIWRGMPGFECVLESG